MINHPLIRVSDLFDLWELEKLEPGQFNWYMKGDGNKAGMNLVCPGCKSVLTVPFYGSTKWDWDGNEEKPTLTPSLHHVGCWHGWLRAGVLVPC